MFSIMVLSSLLSTMNIWVDKIEHIRFSIGDVWMTLLMCGWMFLFMGLYDKQKNILVVGLVLIIFNIWCIRTQFLVSASQYKLGMIPHHSMAIHMSKKLLEKDNSLTEFAENLIETQNKEIEILRNHST